MRAKLGIVASVCLGGILVLGVSGSAHAFFPSGAFNQFNQLEYIKWSWASLNDRNNDGDISGPNEGIEVVIEGGPAGFTDAEVEVVKDSFAVWQAVPTSFIGFQFTGVTEDPLPSRTT